MSDQSRMKLLFALGIFGSILLIVSAGLLIHSSHKKSPFYTTKLVDKDTGETVLDQPNQITESSAAAPIILFGGQQILDNGATQAQYQLIQKALGDYAKTNLQNHYQTLTFIPASVKSAGGKISGSLRLGQSANTVSFVIELSQLRYARVNIKDTGGANGGNYSSGLMKVASQSYAGND